MVHLPDDGLGIYVHVPYCIKKCRYCDFVSFEKAPQDEYFYGIAEDIKIAANKLGNGNECYVDTLFFGGGTPSLANAAQLGIVLDALRKNFEMRDPEMTIEVNPETVTVEKAAEIKALGFNRISMGVQSLNDKVLAEMGRVHDADRARLAYRILRDAGFDNIKVKHASVSEIPADAELVVCHKDLADRARKSAPGAKLVTITNFMTAAEYDQIVQDLPNARINTNKEVEGGTDFHGGILLKKNIILNHPAKTKEEAIKAMGRLLKEGGYVTERYTEAMFEKEKVFNTAIGNSIAIPHGIESMTGEILNSGIAIFTYPNGLDWGEGKRVKLVIGVASVGDDHMTALAKIADACETEEAVERIVAMNQDEVYNLFK